MELASKEIIAKQSVEWMSKVSEWGERMNFAHGNGPLVSHFIAFIQSGVYRLFRLTLSLSLFVFVFLYADLSRGSGNLSSFFGERRLLTVLCGEEEN